MADQARGRIDYWQVTSASPGFIHSTGWPPPYVAEPDLFGCAVTNAWIEDEWAFWLYPRPSLLVGLATPADVTVAAEVVYCPQAHPSLHGYLLTAENKAQMLAQTGGPEERALPSAYYDAATPKLSICGALVRQLSRDDCLRQGASAMRIVVHEVPDNGIAPKQRDE